LPRHVATPVGGQVAGPAAELDLAEVVHEGLQMAVDVILTWV